MRTNRLHNLQLTRKNRNSTISCDVATGSNAAGGPDSLCKSLRQLFCRACTLLILHRLDAAKCYDSLYRRMRELASILELGGSGQLPKPGDLQQWNGYARASNSCYVVERARLGLSTG